MKKYRLTDECMEHSGKKLYRIQALICMDNVKKGDLGGWIEKEDNLSQGGTCWVGGDAKVFDSAVVSDNATVSDNAIVCGYAKIRENAQITGFARIYDRVVVLGKGKVGGESRISGSSIVGGSGVVCDDMRIYNNACIESDLTDPCNIRENLMAQCGLIDCYGKVTCYKVVRNDLSSIYDCSFKYKVGEWAEVENCEYSKRIDAPGLHFGPADYGSFLYQDGYVILIAEVDIDDIITIQWSEIRCKRAFIKGTAQLRRNIIDEGN